MDGAIIIQLIIIIFLTLLNAFFASAEMAIVSADRIKIGKFAEEGNENAKLLLALMDEPSKFLATIQVGITLAGFFSSASAATGLSLKFADTLDKLNVPYAQQISMVVITLLLSYFMLVFGELFPKRVALQKKEAIALSSVRAIHGLSVITSPFIRLLSASSNGLMKLFKISNENTEEEISEEKIKALVHMGSENGQIRPKESAMIDKIFDFDDTLAVEVMTPRLDVFMADINWRLDQVISELNVKNHSRVPVYEGNKDNIVGVLLLKSVLLNIDKIGHLKIADIIREPFFVPETKPIDQLFLALQKNKRHMAILLDEYGVFTGIVTMEDLIEEIMGDILDEFDDEKSLVESLNMQQYLIDGRMTIDDFNNLFKTEVKDQYAMTMSGYIINQLGFVPDEDKIDEMRLIAHGYRFEVKEVEKHIIKKFLLTQLANEHRN